MSTLDDFFGSPAIKECSFCGGIEGNLVMSISDHSGATHWHHEECKAKDDARKGTPLTPTWDEAMDSLA